MSDIVPLSYNPLPRFDYRNRLPTLIHPFYDQGFQSISNPTSGKALTGKLKEYKYLYSANSYLFESIAHLICIAASQGVPALV